MDTLHPTVSLLNPANHRAFEQLLELYREAFPPEERKPPETLHQMLIHPDYRVWSTHRDQQLVAFVIVHLSPTCDIALLEYMAIHSALRGQGIGRHLLEYILPLLHEAHRSVLIEVESDKPVSADQSARTKRKQFYSSFGARELIGLHYLMPQVATGTPPPMNLLLLSAIPRLTLPKPTLHAWLTSLYIEVYRQRPTDPRLTTMLASLPEEIPLL